jgi:lysine 2,3-aminomutase
MSPRRRTHTSTESERPQASDWRSELRSAVSDPSELGRALRLTPHQIEQVARASGVGLPLRVSRYFLGLCDPDDALCPIRRQCIPSEQETEQAPGDLEDPLGEREHEVAPHLIRRYPDRALLVATLQCAVHCRFCTRSRLVRTQAGPTTLTELQPAMAWLGEHPEVREVLVSGGDPLTMSTARLVELLGALRAIKSVELVRIATRTPAALPMRIDQELVDALRPLHPIWFMVHFNHPKELTAEAARALSLLVDGGFPVMSQTVLLRGVNDDERVLAQLFRRLVNLRVRPYYLLHGDVIAGSAHLRTTVEQSVAVYGKLQGVLSGIAVPKLVIDTPGGKGKVPIGPETVVRRGEGVTTVRTYRGELVDILDPPADRTR